MEKPTTDSTSNKSQGIPDAVEFWAENLDPNNLKGVAKGGTVAEIEDEIAFAGTPDVIEALRWLEGQTHNPSVILDLGAGLGSHAMFFARRGYKVIALDASSTRLRELRRRAVAIGCADRMITVNALAESLPFAAASQHAIFSKSSLIHTDIYAVSSEMSRILRAGARSALIEPQPGNPFAWFYRKTLAPKEWIGITHYFTRKMQSVFLDKIGSGATLPYYLFSFPVFALQFALPQKRLFFALLRIANSLDRLLFRILPFLKPLAWFGIIKAEKVSQTSPQ